MYNKIALALAFSPRCLAMLSESIRIKNLFNAELILIHVGPQTEHEEEYLNKLLKSIELDKSNIRIIWKQGKPSTTILNCCKRENIDLLLAGALRRENIFKYYIGSTARKILRRANCSVLLLTNPQEVPEPFKKIVINGTEGVNDLRTIKRGLYWAHMEDASQVHIFKAIPGFGLSMMVAGEDSESEYTETRRSIIHEELEEMEQLLSTIDTKDQKINVKVAAGKAAYELCRFAEKTEADLLIVKAPLRKLIFLDRLFPHYLEQVMSDLPTNLLFDKHNK